MILRLHRFAALEPGPSLLVLGAVHGNETCGTRASARVIEALDSGALVLRRGAVTFLPITNPLAYRLQRRAGDRNLNRNLRPKASPLDFEDRVGNVLCELLASHQVLLDLHSFQAPAAPFVMTGTTALDSPEWAFARSLGVGRCVTGWMEVYADGVRRRQQAGVRSDPGLTDLQYGVGTTEYLRACGGYGVTLECGQHDDPSAVDVAEHMPAGASPSAGGGRIADQQVEVHRQQGQKQIAHPAAQLLVPFRREAARHDQQQVEV